MEELYEELPADNIEEDLYEDLPDSAYQAANQYPFPTPVSPSHNGAPPLPTGPIPQHRPGLSPPPTQVIAPPLPTRSPTTTITTAQVVPPARKKEKEAKKKGATLPPPKSSGGSKGIDIKEIMKKAQAARGDREHALQELESKKQKQEDTPAAPWLNQLRKTTPQKPKEEEAKAPPPWTKRNSMEIDSPSENQVPEFIKRARNLSHHELDVADVKKPPSPVPSRKPPPPASKPPPSSPKPPTAGPKPGAKPPPAAKPRNVPNPAGFQPKVAEGPPQETDDKPAWLKQRERQVNIAKGNAEDDRERPPPPASKPPPSLPNGSSESHTSPPLVKKPPKPVPVRRKPVDVPPPIQTQSNEVISQESPPSTPGSVRGRARTLERGMQRPPTPSSPDVKSTPPPAQPSPSIPPKPKPSMKPPPPTPQADVPKTPPLPVRPAPSSHPPPRFTPPPPPVSEKESPRTFPPVQRPPQTLGEPTPPLGSVLKYRRCPLRSVDPFSPPTRPPFTTKPQYPGGFGGDDVVAEDEEIYDDTVGFGDEEELHNGEPEVEQLYDDVSGMSQPPSITSRPPPPISAPPGPPSSSEFPPPLPASLPPSSRPSVSTLVTEDMNGTISELSNGHDDIIEDDQETYEDLESAADSYAAASSALLSPHPPPVSSVPPPSPQHSIASSGSPSLQRKMKLSKEEKRQQKEDEKKEKERKRLDKEKEKERKKKDEARMKNRLKGIKAFKQFDLKPDIEPLFAVEILLEHTKSKDHLNVVIGEVARVLLINHPKLPGEKYLVEKDDGTIGFLKKNICQRTAYQSVSSVLGTPQPEPVESAFIEEDIYESLPQGDEDFPNSAQPTPNVPPPNPGFRFPPPSQPAPPPPPLDGPEDNYEYLPEPQMAN